MSRDAEQWISEMQRDVFIALGYLRRAQRADVARSCALALKEARRLESDIYRFAAEVYGLSGERIDAEENL